jgi:signal peptidase I
MRSLGVAVVAVSVAACGAAFSPIPQPSDTASPQSCSDLVLGGARLYAVEQHGMEPRLKPGDRILVAPGKEPQRLDVIVSSYPEAFAGPQELAAKRVIGLPGETVEVRGGAVYVAGMKLEEPYVYEGEPTTSAAEAARWVIPDGELFVLGDHRSMSADSRVFGPIPIADVVGVVSERCP